MLAKTINWGQSNINFQSKGEEANGGWRFVVLHHEEALISLLPFWLEINVALTQIKSHDQTKQAHVVSLWPLKLCLSVLPTTGLGKLFHIAGPDIRQIS